MQKPDKILGLIGYPLEHSFSERYFSQKFVEQNISGVKYVNFPLEVIEDFPKLLELVPNLCGLNVTSPHKQKVIKYLTSVDQTAQEINAVNTITVSGNELIGYNTDIDGFRKSVSPLVSSNDKALILGSGGAARAVMYVFTKLGIDFIIVTRNAKAPNEITYENVTEEIIRNHRIIVNCTPLGMAHYKDVAPPLPYEFITAGHLLFDLIYNPEETLFLKLGKEKGAGTKNGLEMLYAQADKAWDIFRANKCF